MEVGLKVYTIAVVNEKGGTGKTTTAVNLSAALGDLQHKVLLVDLDGQAASSRWLGVEEDTSFADALYTGKGLKPLIDVIPNVSLAPASGKLDAVAHDLRPTQGGQLRKLLNEVSPQFEFVIIDCPPSLGNRLIGNALLAASHAIVPVETSILALDGLKILLTTLDDVRDGFDHEVMLAGVLACRFDGRTRLSHLVLDELKRALPGKVFKTVIRENVRMRECPASGMSIIEYAPDSHAAEDYRSLAKELLGLENLICCDAEAAAAAAVGEAMKIGDKLRQAVRGSGGEDREWKNRLTEAQSRLLSEEMPQSKRAGAAASPAAQASPATEAAPVAEASSGTDALLVTDAAPGETVATATHVEESAPVIDFPAVAGVDAAPASETPSEASEPIAETNIADDRTNTSASTDLSDPFDQFVRFQDQHQPEPQTMAEVAPQGAAEDSATASVDANQTPVSAEPEAAQSAPEVIPVLDNPPSAAQSDSQNLPSWDTWLTQDANPLQAPEAAPEPETVPESPRIAAEVNVPEVTAGPEAAAQDVRLEDILPSLRTVKTDGPPPLPRADQPSQDVGIESSDDWSKPPAEEPHETPDCPNLRKYVQQVEFNEEQAAEDKPQAKRGIFSRLLGSKK